MYYTGTDLDKTRICKTHKSPPASNRARLANQKLPSSSTTTPSGLKLIIIIECPPAEKAAL